MTLSRRTWLWTSTAALAAACTRPGPTMLPSGADGQPGAPEGPRPLTRRGAENLIVLAQLGAAVRWLHPSDQAQELEWEPLLLDGVRSLEAAGTRAELVEGLRGLLGEVAPTVVIWRSAKQAEGEALDELACPDAEPEPEPDEGKPADAKPDAEPSRAREPEATHGKGEAPAERPKPPVRTTRGQPSDRKQAELDAAASGEGDAKPSDAEANDAKPKDGASNADAEASKDATNSGAEPKDGASNADAEASKDATNSDAQPSDAGSKDATNSDADAKTSKDAANSDARSKDAESKDAESKDGANSDARSKDAESKDGANSDAKSKDAESKDAESKDAESKDGANSSDDADGEPAPPLPEPLFAAADEPLAITQWHRSGYADGLAEDPGCALRITRDPAGASDCAAPPERRRRRRAPTRCSSCAALDGDLLAPAAPLRVELPRGLASLIPLALWTREGRTLPPAPVGEPAPAFAEAQALAYTLEDRGTRLLAVLRAHALLRRFFPHTPREADAALLPALCAAAEDPSPIRLRAGIEALLAGFADGNAELIVATGKAARRYLPALTLAWIEDRVVVVRSELDAARPGDVVTGIDGASIDLVLAQRLARTAAASPSAAIVRAVAGLLERDEPGATIELALVRTSEDGERERSATLVADQRSDRPRPPADLRPTKPLVELDEHHLYLDATRLARLDAAARRARKAGRVIIDLRGELADPRGSLLAHAIVEPTALALERAPTGPTPAGALELEPIGERRIEPARPRLRGRLIVLADARTRGRAELELLGFDRLGATILGSASAGDLGGVATAWLPGGWRLRFTHSELRRVDGEAIHGRGVSPSMFVAPTRAALEAGEDPLLAAALGLRRG